jgi:hypothetical protein
MTSNGAVTVAVLILAVVCGSELVYVIGQPARISQQCLALAGLVLAMFVLSSQIHEWYQSPARGVR